jgi:YesN/AraC family two-component response regulator
VDVRSKRKRPVSVLLVEDEEVALKLLARILGVQYPHVLFFSAINGRMGLDIFSKNSPDIVITDIRMPGVDGIQMVRECRAQKPDAKFIGITGVCEELILNAADEADYLFDHCITKPIGFPDLFAIVDKCIDEIANSPGCSKASITSVNRCKLKGECTQ